MSSTDVGGQGAFRTRPRWWAELPLIAVVYAAYSAGRLLVAGDTREAVAHAASILHYERILHLDPEHVLNSLFTRDAWLGVPACFSYATLHYVVTPVILVWLWRRHDGDYLVMRTWLMISTLIGLLGFTLLPTAPPRLLPGGAGFHDTLAQYASFGWWGSDASAPAGMGGLTNQYAAMPSLHVGWALWCGIALWRYGRTPLARAAGVAYPVTIALVVLGTANHYLLDAVAGVGVMGIGLLLVWPVRWAIARAVATVTRLAGRDGGPPQNTEPETAATPAATTAPAAAAIPGIAAQPVASSPIGIPAPARAVELAPRPAPRPGSPLPPPRRTPDPVRPRTR